MPVLIAAVILVGLLCALDLVLTLGVVKRLREHTALLSSPPAMTELPVIAVGEEIGEFATSTVAGEPVNSADLAADTLVAFLSPSCTPCREKLADFVAYVHARSIDRDDVLVTVVGDAAEASSFVSRLSPVARVVVEAPDGPVSTAFRAKAYPTMLRVSPVGAGRLVVTANQVDLAVPAAAAA
ncbi:hypothetical protein [Streptomyces sp. NBC_01285]|uniref:TlpA family protein disulfide reductase n=1 Tax=Streptomyces sp. NBC_01285 TaxID=2903813 RepID=UPI002257D53F|nr:hypothetical protein [Streptomyces sp. NBC_01285]MCX4774950.1 hypothetical protein [Streptomyces sp. NBC_01285]